MRVTVGDRGVVLRPALTVLLGWALVQLAPIPSAESVAVIPEGAVLDRARAAKPAAPRLNPSRPVAGTRVLVSGKLTRALRRGHPKAKIQQRTARKWRTLRTVRVRQGRYRGALSAPRTVVRLRTVFPGRVRLVSQIRRLRPAPAPAARLTLFISGGTVFGRPATFSGTLLPAVSGRIVRVEQEVDGAWQQRGTGVTDARGLWSWTTRVTGTGIGRWRATVPDTDIRAISAVLSRNVRGLRGSLTLGPERPDGTRDVIVHPSDEVDAVALFVDERAVGEAVETPSGDWSGSIDVSGLETGEHRVTAQLRSESARGLAASATFRVDRPATALPDGLYQEVVTAGFDWPTTFAVVDGNHTLVAEKSGRVWLNRDGVRDPAPVIDLTAVVDDREDRGLIGLALAPDFDADSLSGWVYLAYVPMLVRHELDWDASQRVTRIALTDGVRHGAEELILGRDRLSDCPRAAPETPDCLPSLGYAHTVDDLVFGPDGALYVSVGDGVLTFGDMQENQRAQSLDVLAGKILRVDPETGLGLEDNPFHTAGDDPADRNRNRVWAYGFRNPFRMTLDTDGSLLVGDVGNFDWEEVSRVRAGENHGWPCYEGRAKVYVSDPRPGCVQLWDEVDGGADGGLSWSLHVYPHVNGLGSVTVGPIVPPSWPASLRGRLVLADYNHAEIRTLDISGQAADGDPRVQLSGAEAGTPVKFSTDDADALWYLSIGEGELRRLEAGVDDGSRCPVGDVRVQWYLGTGTADAPLATVCAAETDSAQTPLELANVAHTVRSRARFRTAGGPLAVRVRAPGHTTVALDGTDLVAGGSDQVDSTITRRVSAGISTLVTEQVVQPGAPMAQVTWEQPGSPPTVSVDLPGGGAWVDPGAPVTWRAQARAGDGTDLSEQVRVDVSLMHHGVNDLHLHQESRHHGSGGTVRLSPTHAPGQTAFRLVASATDADGRTGTSPPVYVCLTGNRVGVCS